MATGGLNLLVADVKRRIRRKMRHKREIMNVSDRIAVIYEGEIVAVVNPKETTEQELGLLMAGSKRKEAGEIHV
ncbi:hypothetical protein CEW92_17935 [Bacillaceae bacterium SAS-127]|nr:hypothetical protein CEW92_17935 [Bacillaceae bacterium SAS-127]